MSVLTHTSSLAQHLRMRVGDYAVLVKLRLTVMVVFSSVLGYVIGASTFSWGILALVALGGLFVTFAANAMNQVLERDHDRHMARTRLRPLVTGRIQVTEAVLFAGLSCLTGVLLLAAINVWAAFLGMLSFVLYAFVYTPLKRIHPVAVLVGAIPGAMPVLIGWISASGQLGHEGFLLFSIQFFWQFPHFWAIAWLGHEDYHRAGFRLLPERNGVPGKRTGLQSFLYATALLVLPLMLYGYGFTGWLGLSLLLLTGLHYTRAAWQLYQHCDNIAARKLLYSSLAYLPLVLLALCIDKWIGL
jgi:protoheme IX farnesyltransferase